MKDTVRYKISNSTSKINKISDLDVNKLIELLRENIGHELVEPIIIMVKKIKFVDNKAYSLFDYDIDSNKVNLSGLMKSYSDTRLKKNIYFIYAGLMKIYLLKQNKETFDQLGTTLMLGIFYKEIITKFGNYYSDEELEVNIYRSIYATVIYEIPRNKNFIPSKIFKTDPKDIDFFNSMDLTTVLQDVLSPDFTVEKLKMFILQSYPLFDLFLDDFKTSSIGFYSDNFYRRRTDKLSKLFNKRFKQLYMRKAGF